MTLGKLRRGSDSAVHRTGNDEHFIITTPPELLTSASAQINLDNSLLSALQAHGDDRSGEPSIPILDEEEEDYDDLKPDPQTIVSGSSGGGVGKEQSTDGKPIDGFARRVPAVPGDEHTLETPRHSTIGSNAAVVPRRRRRSIQVILEKTGKKGRYILTADDPEFREILKSHLDREASALDPSKKQRTRFRDLVFTRQFTTFDRQNPLSSESTFHGFFTLFWIGMGLLLTKVAAQNWRSTGSVLGNAEILHMMTDRDLVVLGLTDGIMCLGTLFGLGLQKMILNGYLSWNRSGWVVQNLWQTFYLFSVIAWTTYREWPWTHTVFIVLHVLVFVMKQHSYAFYNGYCKSFDPFNSPLILTAWQCPKYTDELKT
jgi:sterol O-acyltransferase